MNWVNLVDWFSLCLNTEPMSGLDGLTNRTTLSDQSSQVKFYLKFKVIFKAANLNKNIVMPFPPIVDCTQVSPNHSKAHRKVGFV